MLYYSIIKWITFILQAGCYRYYYKVLSERHGGIWVMCCLQPINMAAKLPWTEDESCTLYIITVRHLVHVSYFNMYYSLKFFTHFMWYNLGIYICDTSPVIQKIRQGCSKEFVDFERCLRENQDNPTSCSPHVARFVACAETVDIGGAGKSLMELSVVNSR